MRLPINTAMLLAGAATALLFAGGASQAQEQAKAIFAGGCFWCVESDFDKVAGVTSTISGYIGGSSDNPTYENHTADGHREAVEITYDPSQTDFETLLATFWRTVDPTDDGGQFCDRGFSYTTAIYAVDGEQATLAEQSKAEAEAALGQPIVTEVVEGQTFWPAEDYHQDYYVKNPVRYNYYRRACGRDVRLVQLWGNEAMQGVMAKN
ncbi:peptide-methionine (S)-S-oxide reductase MsrA [Georhizobium sp. MAB10]|uniref:peptide-methionine (S)-S-oxide reductase MsrA n=1 Tax=Georhizobium sp. MAB10 TaxID=3028319 RepID=UPI003855C2BB